MSFATTIAQLLEKIEHYDKDERYMATSDLCEILKKHAAASNANRDNGDDIEMADSHYHTNSLPAIDAQTEQRICNAVLGRVDDKTNDVQAIAVKTLGVLVTCVHEGQVITIAERLGERVLDDTKGDLRDVYTIGLRTLVTTVPVKMGDIVSNRLTAKLLEGIEKTSPVIETESIKKEDRDKAKVAEEIYLACLDILTELLTRFGSMPFLSSHHEYLIQTTMKGLASKSHLIRKRAGNTIGCLSVVLSDALLTRLVDILLSHIERADAVGKSGRHKSTIAAQDGKSKPTDTTALIRTMCTVSGHVGHRLTQEQIDKLVPKFLKFVNPSDAIAGDDIDDEDSQGSDGMQEEEEEATTLVNELRESCFNGFQSFVLRRPNEIQSHLPQIIHSALAYMRYDPNYSYGDEEGNDGEYEMDGVVEEEEEEEDEDDEYEDDDGYSDDDDDSWKVRRSAIRTLDAVVKAEKNLSSLWNVQYALKKNKKWKATLAAALVNRFKERDENCRVDIINCFNSLLNSTILAASKGEISFTASEGMEIEGVTKVITDFRNSYANAIVVGCEKQLQAKKAGIHSKSAALSLLSSLSKTPGGVGNAKTIESIFKLLRFVFADSSIGSHGLRSNKQLKLDALCFIDVVITCGQHDPVHVKEGLLNIILSDLCKTGEENWYKIISETLLVLSAIPMLLVNAKTDEKDLKAASTALYDAIEPRLAANDFDQEIKESAIDAVGPLISMLSRQLSQEQLKRLLSLILLRLRNETTRIAAMKAIVDISAAKVDLDSFLNDYLIELASLLRQNSRSIKQHAIKCLETMMEQYGFNQIESANNEIMDNIIRDLSLNISDNSDLFIIHLSLQASSTILEKSSSCTTSVKQYLLPAALQLCTLSSLQDNALDSLLLVFQKLLHFKIIGFSDLLASLHSKVPPTPMTAEEKMEHKEASVKKVIANIAKCMASITSSASEVEKNRVVLDLMTSLESEVTSDNIYNVILALRLSGDLGCLIDFNTIESVGENLLNIYSASFDSQYEDVKNSAAYGLGRASIGSLDLFLPRILSALDTADDKKKYLLLSSVREIIYCYKLGYGEDVSPVAMQILPHLRHHFVSNEESIRTMVADCMGSLACLIPDIILKDLQELQTQNSDNALICSTVATSVKLAISGGCDGDKIFPFMPIYLSLLNADDLNVKNAALLMVYTAFHHNLELVLPLLENQIQPALLELSQLKLKRVIDLGPFKETIDDALSLRKAAISIFASCLEKCPEYINISQFLPVLAAALGDVEDIQLQAHQILISLCPKYPNEIFSSVESFIEPLGKTISKKYASKTGAELERAKEWVKSAVRVVSILEKEEKNKSSPKFFEFLTRVKKDERAQAMLMELQKQ